MSFIHEKAQIHTLNKSTEIFDPVKAKGGIKSLYLLSKRWHNKNDNTLTLLVLL